MLSSPSTGDTLAAKCRLFVFSRLINIIFYDIFFTAEPDVHQHVSGDVAPADGAVLGGVGDALHAHHAEHVAALERYRHGDGAQAHRTLLSALLACVGPVGLVLLLGREEAVVAGIVELQVPQLHVLAAALAALGPGAAAVLVTQQRRAGQLQLAVAAAGQCRVTLKTSMSLYQVSMILGCMVRAMHLRALVHLCVLRPDAAQGC